MQRRQRRLSIVRRVLLAVVPVLAFVGLAIAANRTSAATEIVYDALPSVSPDTSYPSQPFQAQQVREFGDESQLGGTARELKSVTVTMVTWAPYESWSSDARYTGKDSWTHPVTLNVYSTSLDANGVPNDLLATTTEDISIPWRPTANPACPSSKWMDSTGACNNGYAFNATFDLSGSGVTLPDNVIVSIAYNTSTWGYAPIGQPGPYDSLNVAIPENQPVTVGSDVDTNGGFWNTATAAWYDDDGANGSNIFRQDTNWSPYGTVALRITASPAFVRSASITSPTPGQTVWGTASFDAVLNDKDGNDNVQWAVRKGTCSAGTGTVAGNVDGYSSPYTWNHYNFHASVDTSSWTPGSYCFVFNPTESAGDAAIRGTVNFTVVATLVPTDTTECKKNGWKTFNYPTFKNQGDCVSWVQHNVNGNGTPAIKN